MPNYKGHLVGGTGAFAISYYLLRATDNLPPSEGYEVVLLYLLCLAGGLFPDIDIQSKGHKLFYQALFVGILFIIAYQKVALFVPLAAVSFFPLFLNHRGITHNPWFLLILSSVIPLIAHWFQPEFFPLALKAALFFTIGGWSHLLLDWGVVGFSKRLFKL